MLVLHALLAIFLVCDSLFVDARLGRIEDVERTQWSSKDRSRRHMNQRKNIIISEWRQVLSPTYSLPLHYMPSHDHPLPPSPYFASLHPKPSTLHLHQFNKPNLQYLSPHCELINYELDYDNINDDMVIGYLNMI